MMIVILSKLLLRSEGPERAARCGALFAPPDNRANGSHPYHKIKLH